MPQLSQGGLYARDWIDTRHVPIRRDGDQRRQTAELLRVVVFDPTLDPNAGRNEWKQRTRWTTDTRISSAK
jgi:hypothetical protein